MFAVAVGYEKIAPGLFLHTYWFLAWQDFFHEVNKNRPVSICAWIDGKHRSVKYDPEIGFIFR